MKKILFLSIIAFQATFSFAQIGIIAHRGFWNAENTAENSIMALFNAQCIQVYASEFDVVMTSDKIPVVNYSNLIHEREIEKTPYKEIKDYQLKNGENLPTLESYLQQGSQDRKTRLVLELKPHSTPKIETEAVEIVAHLIEKYDLSPQIIFSSFSFHICTEFVRLFPASEVAYLNGDMSPSQLKEAGVSIIDYRFSRFQEHPEWVEEAHQLGMKVDAWTVNKEEDIREMIALGIDFITTDYPLLVKKILRDTP